VSGRYKVVTDSFGRAEIHTAFALDTRRGAAQHARFVFKEELPIPIDADLVTVLGAEIERNREAAKRPGSVAAVVGIDPKNWSLTRIMLTEDEPDSELAGVAYEVLYLARPELDALPPATGR